MVKLKQLLAAVDKELQNHYPISGTTHKDGFLISHLVYRVNDYSKIIPFDFDITGKIIDGTFANYSITKVCMSGGAMYTWHEYIRLMMEIIGICCNPCVSGRDFIILCRVGKVIADLSIDHFIATGGRASHGYPKEITGAPVNSKVQRPPVKLYNLYMKRPDNYSLPWISDPKFVGHDNHFLFTDFNFGPNRLELGKELSRLFQHRDRYKEIHIHLNNNAGGQLVPVYFIVKCLCGSKRLTWMRPQTAYNEKDNIVEWDPWVPEEDGQAITALGIPLVDIDAFTKYKTKYSGKIYIHMSPLNGSACFFLITYLVYAFGTARRYTRECFGKQLKFGTGDSTQLKLLGTSNTTSGDGNTIRVKCEGVEVDIPQQQFLKGSINPIDWNRFWTESNK